MEDYSKSGFSALISRDKVVVAGRVFTQDTEIMNKTVIRIIRHCEKMPKGSRITVFCYLDYVTSWARKRLLQLFRNLDQIAERNGVDIDVRWAFLEQDGDMFDLGELYSEEMENVCFMFNEMEA